MPGPNDVLVRTTAASMCSADLATIEGAFDFASGEENTDAGVVVGHEAIGMVHATGELVEGFKVDDRVASMSTTPCGQCVNCQRGFRGHCGSKVWGGYMAGVTLDGTLSEFYLVPDAQHNLCRIPDDLTDEEALLGVDTLASGSSGIEGANIPLGGVVVVIGQGHVGLAAMATARQSGAGLVIGVKNRPGGEERAAALGADTLLNNHEHDVRTEILRLTDGQGADCVVEASGSRQGFPLAVELTRVGGTISILSSYESLSESDDGVLGIPLEHWGWGLGDKTIISTFQRCGKERLSRLYRLLQNKRIDASLFFTDSYHFNDIERAIADLADPKKSVLKQFIKF